MTEKGISIQRTEIPTVFASSRAFLALGLALALAACAAHSARTPEDFAKAGAFVKEAVVDTEKVARRAHAYHSANVRKQASIEVEEAEVILRKARDQQERIRKAHSAAIAVLEALPKQDSDATAAADNVERISAILATTDRNVAKIEETVATLQELEIPGRR
jgi:myosin heavy subunit